VFDGLSGVTRTVKLRPKQPSCAVCGENPTITELIDYELFCGSRADDKSAALSDLEPGQRVTCQQYKEIVDSRCAHLLLDVREPVQYDICHLQNSTSERGTSFVCTGVIYADYADIPLSQLENPKTTESAMKTVGRSAEELVLEHNLQGLLTLLIPCKQLLTTLQCFQDHYQFT
jgi:hypothetical protein